MLPHPPHTSPTLNCPGTGVEVVVGVTRTVDATVGVVYGQSFGQVLGVSPVSHLPLLLHNDGVVPIHATGSG